MIDPTLVQRFDDPPPEYGPTPLWWWSGATVSEDGISWQLQRFVDGGIHNLVLMNLAPKGPTYGAPADDPEWFSPRWWDLLRHTCVRAAELGVKLWFYDQIGFSGANLQGQVTAAHPEAAGRSLRSRTCEAGPGGAVDLAPREHLLGIYDAEPDADGGHRQHVPAQGCVDVAEGHRLRIVAWHESAFDYLTPESVALLLDRVHGEFERQLPEHLGSTIVGSFQDELPAMPTWSAGFAERFAAECGYDLRPRLAELWDLAGERSDRLRGDYHRVRTLLAEEAFFRPLGLWHRDRGMLLGADQMNPARAGVPTQSAQLYGDYFTTHRWFDAVGSDHEGDARVHSSMADLYDHPRVWIESFHSSGWGGTLEETWDWLIPFFRSGADLYNPHASYYGLQAGWFEWAPPSTDFRQPYYEVYPEFSRAVARVSALMTWGRHAVDLALLYPSAAVQAGLPPDLPIDHFDEGDVGPEHLGVDEAQRSYLALAGKNDWFRAAPGLLDLARVDFDVVDDDSVVRSSAQDGALHVNGFAFRTVVLPQVRRLSSVVADRLVGLLDAGGRVVVVGAPPRSSTGGSAGSGEGAGDEAGDEAVVRLADHPRLEVVAGPEAAADLLAAAHRPVVAPHGVRVRTEGDLSVALVPAAFPNATAYPLRTVPGAGSWDDLDFDAARYEGGLDLRVAGVLAEAEIWNPATGERRAASLRVDGEDTVIAVKGGGAPLLVVVWRSGGAGSVPDAAPTAAEEAGTPTEVPLDWQQELVPTMDNRWGDFALPASTDPVPAQVWALDLVEADRRTPVRVTFGQELLVREPAAGRVVPLSPAEAAAARAGGPLAGADWQVQRYSASLGRDAVEGVNQDPKGFVSEEFLVHRVPAAGEEVAVRALVRVAEPGSYDLTVSSACAVRAWLDGEEVPAQDEGYEQVFAVRFGERVAVLELRLAHPGGELSSRPRERMTGAFTLSRPGERVPRPQFVAPGPLGVDADVATFRRTFHLEADASAVRVVTGAPTALSVVLDGRTVARQEKVEYYEDGLGVNPMYFTHRLGGLLAGEHRLEVVVDGAGAQTPLFVDLVAELPGGSVAVPSGPGWTVGRDDVAVTAAPQWTAGTTHARAAQRPHPLAAAHWLSGPPDVGGPAVPFETSVSAVPRSETFEALLPPGTVAVELSTDALEVTLDAEAVEVVDRRVTFTAATTEPRTLQVTSTPRAFSTSGAVWDGPLTLETVTTPAVFSDWSEQGLGAWSGAVRYTATLPVGEGEELRLSLGRVRGAVTIDVDGRRVGSAFCAPFVFPLSGLAQGSRTVAVTVYGTLGPRYASATPSTFFVPSQLRTGLQDPIRVERVVR